jgi:D-alanine-D-alanine ligase
LPDKKLNIALFVGGTSPEREVSKSSGKAIYSALKSLNYNCRLIDPAYGIFQPENDDDFFAKKNFAEISNVNLLQTVGSDLLNNIDIVFNALHGKWGEDGVIQSLLELKGIKYTGSGIYSSSAAMDKVLSKTLFKLNGVNTAEWFTIGKTFNLKEVTKQIKFMFGFPCVVKPNDQGSTVGLSIAKNENEIRTAVELALKFSNLVLIEKYIPGREVTVAVLEDKPLPVLEIIPKSGFYDYESKYTSGMSEYFVPADIPKDVFTAVQQQAVTAFNCLRCEVYGRVDFRLNEQNIPYCLEVNTLPGMTDTSLVPKMANAAGISFEELIDRIIKVSLDGKK